ncbi:MAG TPA: SRPBCC family protein [Alphaproteobacteria bacterium]
MLNYILIIVVAGLVILGVLIIRQPDQFRVTRTLKMAATPDTIFPHINNFRMWQSWSPWVEMDPNAVMHFEGPETGKGAKTTWKGNNQIGEGSLTILESVPSSLIRYRLDFIKPMAGISYSEFKFLPQGDQTMVSWTMYGQNTWMGKIIGLFMNCEKMIGTQFDKGLNNLKRVVEEN